MKKLIPLLLSGAMLLGSVGCSKSGSVSDSGNAGEDKSTLVKLPRDKTLYITGFESSDPTTFNPLNDWPSWPVRPEFNLMYETVTTFNSYTGTTEPLLGAHDETNNEYVSALLNPHAMWSDSVPLTGEDIKYSFELGLQYPAIPSASGVDKFLSKVVIDTISTITIVTASNDTVTVRSDKDSVEVLGDTLNVLTQERVKLFVDKKNRNNPLVLEDLLSSVSILPKHIYAPMFDSANGDLGSLQELKMDKAQIVSGPYNLYAYTNEKIIVKRRDDYWGNDALYGGKKAAPTYIIHPIYKGNDHANTALRHGEVDISSNFIPRIWFKMKKQKMVDGVKRGVKSWMKEKPYFLLGSIPMFIINTTKKPMDDNNFRRSMALAINYDEIRRLAVSNYTAPLKSGLILPFSFAKENKYYDSADVAKYGATKYDSTAARALLAKSGYKAFYDDKGNLEYTTGPKGDTLPTLFIKCPSGWSDFESIVRISVKSMRKCGIDIREGFVDESLYWPAQHTGDFDLLMDTPSAKLSNSMPWARFETIMSSHEWKPIGDKMYVNMGRFNNPNDSANYIPAVDSLIEAIPHMLDEAQRTAAYKELNKIFMEQQPTIPVCYRPEEFYEFNDSHWKGFATSENPYAPQIMPCEGAATKMLWHIEPVIENEGK